MNRDWDWMQTKTRQRNMSERRTVSSRKLSFSAVLGLILKMALDSRGTRERQYNGMKKLIRKTKMKMYKK